MISSVRTAKQKQLTNPFMYAGINSTNVGLKQNQNSKAKLSKMYHMGALVLQSASS